MPDFLEQNFKEALEKLHITEKKIGITSLNINVDKINEYLSLSDEDLAKFTSSDLSVISYRLTEYSLYIQQQINILNGMKVYIQSKLKEMAAKEIAKFKGYSWEYAEKLAIAQNDYAILLNEKLIEINMSLSMYEGIPDILAMYSKKIDNLGYVKGHK